MTLMALLGGKCPFAKRWSCYCISSGFNKRNQLMKPPRRHQVRRGVAVRSKKTSPWYMKAAESAFTYRVVLMRPARLHVQERVYTAHN